MALSAYWVNPKGKVFELKGKYHISYIISNPHKFGETKDTVQKSYDEYDEKMGWEGKAREEIITRVLKRGFIRIREYNNRWSIQLWKMTSKFSDIIWEWASSIFANVYDKYADVTIHELSTNKLTKTSFNKLTEETGMSSIISKYLDDPRSGNITIVESIEEFDDIKSPEVMNEASLGRLLQHINKGDTKSWSIQTSWRDENTLTKNKSDFKTLKSDIRGMNLGFITLKGMGQEEGEDGVESVSEPSLFIPNITFDQAKKLSNKFNQWGFIYSGEEVNDKISLVSNMGKTVENIGSFHPGRISQFYSKIKGKTFTFEGIVLSGWIEGLQLSRLDEDNSLNVFVKGGDWN